jgi:4-amino-4-deoxy-L-arabinose transferase-like glycosyltransferase
MSVSTGLSPNGRVAGRPESPSSLSQALGRFAVRRYRLGFTLVLVLMAWNVFAGLGSVRLNDSDEARYGVSAYEMLQNQDLIVTTYGGEREYWNLKPPLGYWLMALSFSIFGPTPFALRLPAALCGIGAVAVSMVLGRRWMGRRASLLTGLILATAFGFLSNHGARSGDLDAMLTLLLLLALWVVAQLGESPWRIVLLGALLAAGFLLKSFAILPLILVAALYALWSGAWRKQRVIPCLVALAAFLVPVAAWAVARCQADGSTYFLERMVKEDLLARSTSIIDKVSRSPFGYVGTLFDRLAPWPLLILAGAFAAAWTQRFRLRSLIRTMRTMARGKRSLILLWALVPLVLFSLSLTQHHWYLDPSYPAWAMLAALAVLSLLRRAAPARRSAVLLACAIVPLALCEVRVLYRVLIAERMPESQQVLASLAEHRLELGPYLRTGPLRHSERFILEAMCGFSVEEDQARPLPAVSSEETPSVLIVKAAKGPRPQPSLGSGIFLDTRDYLLYQSSSQIAGRSTGQHQRSHGRPAGRRRPRGSHLPAWRPRSRAIPS